MLDWDGELVDFVDAAVTWFGMGYKPLAGLPDPGGYDTPRNVLFGTGAAMFVRADVFESVGGFDERYFMFYEDVDLGWRLNLLGWKVRYEPRSLAFHHHHASMKKFGAFRETYLLERNALFTLYKNLDDESLAKVFPGALLLAVRRAISRGELDSTELDLRRPGGDATPERPVSKETLAGIYAVDQLVEKITTLTETRQDLQRRRRVSDDALRPLFGTLLEPAYSIPSYLDGHQELIAALGIEDSVRKKRIVIITGEPVSTLMAGPAIRAWNMAQHLSPEHDVRLLTFGSVGVDPRGFDVLSVSPHDAHAADVHVDWADIIIFQGHAMAVFPALQETDKIIVVDLYDPMHLEQLEQAKERGPTAWAYEVESATKVLNQQMERGDFFLCASERQRHFWLGQLASLGRLNPLTYAADNSLQQPAGTGALRPGLARTGPHAARHARGGAGDRPGRQGDHLGRRDLQLVRPVEPDHGGRSAGPLAQRCPAVLPRHAAPEPARPRDADGGQGAGTVRRTRADRQERLLQREVGAVQRSAELPDGRRRRGEHALRAHRDDVLVPHPDPGLPVGAPADRHHPGRRLRRPGRSAGAGGGRAGQRPAALAAALESMLYDPEAIAVATKNVGRVREDFTWDKALAPLVEFCRDPRPAPDRVPPEAPGDHPAAGQPVPGAAGAGPAPIARRRSATSPKAACAAWSTRQRRGSAATARPASEKPRGSDRCTSLWTARRCSDAGPASAGAPSTCWGSRNWRAILTSTCRCPRRPSPCAAPAHSARRCPPGSVRGRCRCRPGCCGPSGAVGRHRRSRLFSGPADVFHGTNFVLPPTGRAGGVVTVHDLAFLTMPDTVDATSRALRELVPRSLSRAAAVCTPTRRWPGRSGSLRARRPEVIVTPLGVDPGWFSTPRHPITSCGPDWRCPPTISCSSAPASLARISPRCWRRTGSSGRPVRATEPPSLLLVGPSGWGPDEQRGQGVRSAATRRPGSCGGSWRPPVRW